MRWRMSSSLFGGLDYGFLPFLLLVVMEDVLVVFRAFCSLKWLENSFDPFCTMLVPRKRL